MGGTPLQVDALFQIRFLQTSLPRLIYTKCQDAVRHGQTIAASLLEQKGGLLSNDPRLAELVKVPLILKFLPYNVFFDIEMQEQNVLLKHEQKNSRKPKILEVVKNCPEMTGTTFIQDVFLPSLKQFFSELEIQVNHLREDLIQSNPILAQFFPVALQKNQLQTRPSELVQQAREVWILLLAQFWFQCLRLP